MGVETPAHPQSYLCPDPPTPGLPAPHLLCCSSSCFLLLRNSHLVLLALQQTQTPPPSPPGGLPQLNPWLPVCSCFSPSFLSSWASPSGGLHLPTGCSLGTGSSFPRGEKTPLVKTRVTLLSLHSPDHSAPKLTGHSDPLHQSAEC